MKWHGDYKVHPHNGNNNDNKECDIVVIVLKISDIDIHTMIYKKQNLNKYEVWWPDV